MVSYYNTWASGISTNFGRKCVIDIPVSYVTKGFEVFQAKLDFVRVLIFRSIRQRWVLGAPISGMCWVSTSIALHNFICRGMGIGRGIRVVAILGILGGGVPVGGKGMGIRWRGMGGTKPVIPCVQVQTILGFLNSNFFRISVTGGSPIISKLYRLGQARNVSFSLMKVRNSGIKDDKNWSSNINEWRLSNSFGIPLASNQ